MPQGEVNQIETIGYRERRNTSLTEAHFQRLFAAVEPTNLPQLAEGSPRAVASELYNRFFQKKISYAPNAKKVDFQTIYRKEEAFETTMRLILEDIEKKNPEMDFRQRRALNTEIILAYWLTLGGGIEEISNTGNLVRRSHSDLHSLEQRDDSHLAMTFLEEKMAGIQERATGASQGYELEVLPESDSYISEILNVCDWHDKPLLLDADTMEKFDKQAANSLDSVLLRNDFTVEQARNAAQKGAIAISTLASLGACTIFLSNGLPEFQTNPSFNFDLQMAEIEYILRSRAHIQNSKFTEKINMHASYGVELSPEKTEVMDVRAIVEASGFFPDLSISNNGETRVEGFGKLSPGGRYFPFFVSKDSTSPGVQEYPPGNTTLGLSEFRSFKLSQFGDDFKDALRFMHAASLCIDAVHKKDQADSPLAQAWTDLMNKWTSIFTTHFPGKDYPGNGEGERFISFEKEYVNEEGEVLNTTTEEFRIPPEKKGKTTYEKLITLLSLRAVGDKAFANETRDVMSKFSAKVEAISRTTD